MQVEFRSFLLLQCLPLSWNCDPAARLRRPYESHHLQTRDPQPRSEQPAGRPRKVVTAALEGDTGKRLTVGLVCISVMGITALHVGTAAAFAQNGKYFVETDYVRVQSDCTTGSRTVCVIRPDVPIRGTAGYQTAERVRNTSVWWRFTDGACVTSAYDTSSFRSPAELMRKYGIGPYRPTLTNPTIGGALR